MESTNGKPSKLKLDNLASMKGGAIRKKPEEKPAAAPKTGDTGGVKTYTELKKSEAKLQMENQKLSADLQAAKESEAKLKDELENERSKVISWKSRAEALEAKVRATEQKEIVRLDFTKLEQSLKLQRQQLEAIVAM